MSASVDPDELRGAFVSLLIMDGPTTDRRRKDYNQAVFFPLDHPSFPGNSIWSSTTLGMVLEKFDRAVKATRR